MAPVPCIMSRNGSPASGSILMTRAPKSANVEAPSGAAMMVAASTTVMPARGRPPAVPECAADVAKGRRRRLTLAKSMRLAVPPGRPGVAVRSATGPSWMPPSTAAAWPLATMSGSRSAAWVVWYW